MVMSNVTNLFERKVSDIPAMLRNMADRVEAGEVDATSMLTIAIGDEIQFFNWGDSISPMEILGYIEYAKLEWIDDYIG